jgi:class 3 adenylate cyclase/tetratricopeptide (TPR) repeat protein
MARRISSPVFVGRAAELADIATALARAQHEAAVVLVSGPAGIGKSRLVAEAGARARLMNVRVLEGSCLPVTGGSLPYEPFVSAFRGLGDLEPAVLRGILGAAEDELTWLVPALADALSTDETDGQPAPTRGAGDRIGSSLQAEGRLFELILGVVSRLAELAPTMIAIEDIQWADPGTLDLVAYLARNLRDDRVLLLITARDDLRPPLLTELERDSRVDHLALAPFESGELEQLLAGILGRPPSRSLAERVARRSEGNPFFAEELLAAADANAARPEAPELPPTLRELLVRRLDGLSPSARRAVDVAALIGRNADEDLIGRVAELPASELFSGLREAIARGILEPPSDSGAVGYRLRHGLLAEAAVAGLLPGERRQLHGAIAIALQERSSATEAASSLPIEIANHWRAAGNARETLRSAVAAGNAAASLPAHSDAAHQYEVALGLWSQIPDAAELAGQSRRETTERAAGERFLAGDFGHAVELTKEAISRARSGAEDTDRVALAHLHDRLAAYLSAMSDDVGALAAVRESVKLLSDGPASVPLASALAIEGAELMLLGQYRDSMAPCKRSLEILGGLDAPLVEGPARSYLGVSMVYLGSVEEGLGQLARGLTIVEAEEPGDEVLEIRHNLACMLDVAGRLEEAAKVADESVSLARRLGLERRSGAGLLSVFGLVLYRLGRWPEALAAFLEGLRLEPSGEPALNLNRGLGRLEVGLGRWDDAARHLGLAGEDPRIDSLPDLAAGRAELAIWQGRLDDARAILAAAFERLDQTDELIRVPPLCSLGLRAEADRAEAARVRRTTLELAQSEQIARTLMDRAERCLDRLGQPDARLRTIVEADVRLCKAELSRALGQPDASAWLAAAESWHAAMMPYPAAYARSRAAAAMLGARTSRSEAEDGLRAAHASAVELGAEPLRRMIEEVAARARVELGAAPRAVAPRAKTPSEAEGLGLTPRELEILGLVAEGRTNRQIADALFITEKTAGVHMTNILGKLGVRSRYDAGEMAVRLGLVGPARRAGVDETVTRTFLFTDIVGSTKLIEAIGDEAWADLLRWHDETMRDIFRRTSGEEIDHAGDGFFVAFAQSADALDSAVAIQRALTRQRREHGFAPQVRIGLHRTAATRTANGYSGKGVHEAARIAGAAAPAEVLVSRSTIDELGRPAPVGRPRLLEAHGLSQPISVVPLEWREKERV